MFCTQKEDSKLIVLKKYISWAVVVVEWSACSPSTPTIQVRIPFSVKFVCEKNENKQKEAGAAPLFYKKILPIHFSSIPSFALFDSSWLTASLIHWALSCIDILYLLFYVHLYLCRSLYLFSFCAILFGMSLSLLLVLCTSRYINLPFFFLCHTFWYVSLSPSPLNRNDKTNFGPLLASK